jgi:hypothetical protein
MNPEGTDKGKGIDTDNRIIHDETRILAEQSKRNWNESIRDARNLQVHSEGGESSQQGFALENHELLLFNSREDELMGRQVAEALELETRQMQELSELMERQEQEKQILNNPGVLSADYANKLAIRHFEQKKKIDTLHVSDNNKMKARHEENWYNLYARAEEDAGQNVSDVQEVKEKIKNIVIEKVGKDVYNDSLDYRQYHYSDAGKKAFGKLTKKMQERLLLAKRQVNTEYERIRFAKTDIREKNVQIQRDVRANASIARAYFDAKGIFVNSKKGNTPNNALKAFLAMKSEDPELVTKHARGWDDEKWKAKMNHHIANPDAETTDEESARPKPSQRSKGKK